MNILRRWVYTVRTLSNISFLYFTLLCYIQNIHICIYCQCKVILYMYDVSNDKLMIFF